jgi:uncharacterized protein involved in response to NO
MMKHAAFHQGYIWAALALALFVGFAIGAHLTFILGFGFMPSPGFASFIQIHGHIQLVGWAGLFIMGISLHFMPRLAGVPIAQPHWLSYILWCMTCGLGLRTLSQSVLPYLVDDHWRDVMLGLAVASGVLELGGTALYIVLLLQTLRAGGQGAPRPALHAVQPYMQMMLWGWSLHACLNLVLLVAMARQRQTVLPMGWHNIAIESFIGLVLLPVAFAFSVRLFPLYLRLPTPHRSVRGLAYAYLIGWLLQIVPTVVNLQRLAPQGAFALTQIGLSCKAGAILWFVWRLQVLSAWRLAPPRRQHTSVEPARGQGRPDLPVHRAFGHFAYLVYSAYAWLVLAACSDMITGIAGLFGYGAVMNAGAVRHMYVLGFITLLISGVSVRMLPGFLGQKQVRSPALVTVTLWLGNTAVLCRILIGAPTVFWQALPGVVPGVQIAFALSGLLGLAAVGCLGVNLWCTARQTRAALAA